MRYLEKIPCQIFLLSNDLDATRKKKRKIQSFSKNVLFATAAYQFRTDGRSSSRRFFREISVNGTAGKKFPKAISIKEQNRHH